MKFSGIGRLSMALAASVALGLGMTACGGGTVGYMWVAGTTSTSTTTSRVVGFKIDDYTGNLTQAPLSPYATAGDNPANLLVKPGGRFVYLVNQGTTITQPNGTVISNHDGNIAEFLVGGDGRLTFQSTFPTQGQTPVWAAMDSSGSYLYALDSLAPQGTTYYNAGQGDITVFAIDPNTGRLSLVTNSQIKDQNDQNINFFPVGPSPTRVKTTSGGCLFVLDKASTSNTYQTAIFPYQISSGQLIQSTNSQIITGATNLSSINTGGGNGTSTVGGSSNIYATDIGPQSASGNFTTAGQIYTYTVGSSCSLNAVASSPFANLAPATDPTWAQEIDFGSSRFLYVLNQNNSDSTQTNSSVSIFTIDSTGKLTQSPAATNPLPVGAGPTCMLEDPTNQYVYISNLISGNVIGKRLDVQQGNLNDLPRGSTFAAVNHASCLAVSGAVD